MRHLSILGLLLLSALPSVVFALGLGNIRLDLADFVDPGAYDFRLRSQAAAIDAAANPGEVAGGSLRLTPSVEYVHSRASRKRPQVGRLDAGAFEFQPAEQ